MGPDMFIKLFHRPNYSVWKHWLRQHQMRMMKKNEAMMQQRREQGMAEGMHLDDNDMNMMNHDMSNMHMEDPLNGMADDTQPQFLAQQAAAMAVIEANGDDEDEFKYNYDNPLDSSHFVPNMNDPLADD